MNIELPSTPIEKVKMLESTLVSAATGGARDDAVYQLLRRELMSNSDIKGRLPEFVRTHRNLDAFWPFIKNEASTYAERRKIIHDAFGPLFDHLEAGSLAPLDNVVSDAISSFDVDGIQAIWVKALDRRTSDPEGAITIARTLLEAVTKHILDESGVEYAEKDDLPKLYGKVAGALNLAPSQHTEEPIKAILGGAMNLVNGIGTLRNRLSDSHGRSGKAPVRPSERHAKLAVNTAGAIATFLIETFEERQSKK